MFLAFIAIVSAGTLGFFLVDQRRRGRFRRATPPHVERAAFEATVVPYPAEVVGAALDDTVGADQVKAILARLIIERKIAAEVADGAFRLRLLVPRTAFAGGYEAKLIRVLFVRGDTIDRKSLVEYWTERHAFVPDAQYELTDLPEIFSRRFFDPAVEIAEELLDDAHRFTSGSWNAPRAEPSRALFADLTEEKEELLPPEPPRNVMAWAYAALLTLGVHNCTTSRESGVTDPWFTPDVQIVTVAGLGLHWIATKLADAVRRKPTLSAIDVAIVGLPMLVLPAIVAARAMPAGARFVAALLFAGSMINVVLRARSGSAGRQNDTRQMLLSASRYLENEVVSPAPQVPLSWVPHVFAFGLGDRIDPSGVGADVFQPSGGIAEWNRQVSALIARFTSRDLEGE